LPSAFVFLDALPQAPNGKLNRRELPEPDSARPQLGNPYVAPRTVAEEVLSDIWAEVLGLDQVGTNDNFLELGGDSLLASLVVSRVLDTFQVELSPRILLEAPTVSAMLRTMVEHEAKLGQTEKIAEILQRVKEMSDEEVRKGLEHRMPGGQKE